MAPQYAAAAVQLLEATRAGDLLKMHKLLLHDLSALKNGPQPALINTVLNDMGQSAMHVAVERGNEAAVVLLLAHKADPTLENKSGKSAVEMAFEQGAQGILSVLTDAKKASARMKEVRAFMKRETEDGWARDAKFSIVGRLFVFLTCCLWVLIFFGVFASLYPERAKWVLGPTAHSMIMHQLSRFDEYIKASHVYKPKIEFHDGTPQVIKDILLEIESARLADKAKRDGDRFDLF